MIDSSTLMAYLIPKLTRQVENAATEALGYILNRSTGAMQALNGLLGEGGFDVPPIVRVETQVTYEDGSRPDMGGYDKNNVKRLLVEAKFWAALLSGQASGYAQQFEHSGSAVLLFVCPEVRFPTLWVEINRQLEKDVNLELIHSPPGVHRARVIGQEIQVMMVSWSRLLDRMDAAVGDESVKSDIRQLRGLVQGQDAEAFLPLHSEDLSPSLGRRLVWYRRLVLDVFDSRGIPENWIDVKGLRATPQSHGYGRYLRFAGVEGLFWFGVNDERWAESGDTPLWLLAYSSSQAIVEGIGRQLGVLVRERWIPIYPKLGVEYSEVLDYVVSQLKTVSEILRSNDLKSEDY